MKSISAALKRDAASVVVPWTLYGIGNALDSVATGAALAFAALMLIRRKSWSEFKVYDLAVSVFFVVITIGIGFFKSPAITLSKSFLAPLMLATATWSSSLLGTPYTLHYAKSFADPYWWTNPHFIYVNHILTWFWASIFSISALLGLSQFYFGWPSRWIVLGVSLLLTACALHFTKRFPLWYRLHRFIPLVRAGKEPYYPAPRI